jgi:hypothetical protein
MTIVSHIHLKLQIPIPMLLVDCVTKNRLISTLERKRRLIVMTRSILEKLSFVVHFINDTV